MITKDNLNIYDDLYLRANLVLAKAFKDSRWTSRIQELYGTIYPGKTYTESEKPISNINIYYTFLKILSEFEKDQMDKDIKNRITLVSEENGINEKFQPIFTMLPFDEPRFKINLNTRRIEMPAGFVGQQVQSDNYAETIWFEVDRYFDATDLYTTDISIQWENGSVKKITQALNPVANLDIASVYGKIIFGWPLTKEVTQNSGNVKFSVRFQKRNNDKVVYNLNTLPMNLRIHDSLIFDDTDSSIEILDTSDNFYANMQYEHYYTVTPAAVPSLQFIGLLNADGAPDTTKNNSDLKNDSLFLYAKGFVAKDAKDGAGSIAYRWIGYNEDDDTIVDMGTEKVSEAYVLSMDTAVNTNEIYYKKNGNKYTKADMSTVTNPKAEKLYQVYSQFEAEKAGKYGVEIFNWFGGDQKSYLSNLNEIFAIPFAEQPKFSTTENQRVQIAEGQSKEIQIAVGPKNEGKEQLVKFVWIRTNKATDDPSKASSDDKIESNNNKLSLKNDNLFKEGYYWLQVTSSRNKDETSAIGPHWVRVTKQVEVPVVTGIKVGGVSQSLDKTLIDLNGSGNPIVLEIKDVVKDEDLKFEWKHDDVVVSNINKLVIGPNGDSGTYKCTITNTYNGFEAKAAFEIIVIA